MTNRFCAIVALTTLLLFSTAYGIEYEFSTNGKDYSVNYEPQDFRATRLGPFNLTNRFGHQKASVGTLRFGNTAYQGFYRTADNYGDFGPGINIGDCYLMSGPFQTFSGNGKIFMTFDWFAYVEAPHPSEDTVLLHFFIKRGTENLEYKNVKMGDFNRWADSYSTQDTDPAGSSLTTIVANHYKHQSGQITLSYQTDDPAEKTQIWGGVCAFEKVGVGIKKVKMQFTYND